MVYLIDTSDKEPRIAIAKDGESLMDGNVVWLDIPRDAIGAVDYGVQVIVDVCQPKTIDDIIHDIDDIAMCQSQKQ